MTFAFGILQVLLILRIILLLLVANPGNESCSFVFNITQPFVEPFVNMFSLNHVTADQGSVLDISAIVGADRLDAGRGAGPRRDPDLLATVDRDRLILLRPPTRGRATRARPRVSVSAGSRVRRVVRGHREPYTRPMRRRLGSRW